MQTAVGVAVLSARGGATLISMHGRRRTEMIKDGLFKQLPMVFGLLSERLPVRELGYGMFGQLSGKALLAFKLTGAQ